MLVLSRQRDEIIVIPHPSDPEHPIEITVVDIRGDKVRLGITADKDVPIYRKDVWEKICAEADREKAAACAGPTSEA